MRRNVYTRWQKFAAGLDRLGFEVGDNPHLPRPGDVLVIWNRYARHERAARQYEAAGGTVIVAENGWIGRAPPEGSKPIALCRSHHNGAGAWPIGDQTRWPLFEVELLPWRSAAAAADAHILMLPQRGIGEHGIAMPHDWLNLAITRLRKRTKRRIVVRMHPGMHEPRDPDFAGAPQPWAAVTWGSGAAIKALAAGIPVFHEMPNWVGAPAAHFGLDHLEEPVMGDRLPMFQRLAWAQWSADEIATGEPLARLIER